MAQGFSSLFQQFINQKTGTQQTSEGLSQFGALIGKQALANQQTQADLANLMEVEKFKSKTQQQLKDIQFKQQQQSKDIQFKQQVKLKEEERKGRLANLIELEKFKFSSGQDAEDSELQRQIKLAEVKAKLGEKEPSALEELISRGKAADAAKTLGDRPLFNSLRGLGTSPGISDKLPTQAPTQQLLQGQFGGLGQQFAQSTEQQDLIPSKIKTDPFGGIQATEFTSRQALIDENVLKESIKASGKQLQTLVKTSGNLSRVENAFSGLVAQAKRAVNEQGGFGATAAITARAKRFGQRFFGRDVPLEEQFGGLAGFDAQRQETILALSPILTGQNRILRSALVMLKKTVPDLPILGTTEAEFGENVRQSMKNAFKLSLGVSRGLLTPEQMADLTQNATDDQITTFLTNLVDRTRFTAEDEKFFNQFFERVIKTPATKPVGLFTEGEKQFGRFGGNLKGRPTGERNISNMSDEELRAIVGEQ